jgi:hypothetical protein
VQDVSLLLLFVSVQSVLYLRHQHHHWPIIKREDIHWSYSSRAYTQLLDLSIIPLPGSYW